MKIVKKVFCPLLILTVLAFSFPTKTSANAKIIGPFKLTGGVGDYGSATRLYYITASASGYTTQIYQAMDSWIYTTSRLNVTTSISWSPTTSQSSSVMDIYYGDYFSDGTVAGTTFWLYNEQLNPRNSNWGWGKIQLDSKVFPNLSQTNRQGTIAHEMGHVFGLDETNNDPNSIMCQLSYGRSVYMPQVGDLRPIQTLYP